MKVSVYVCIYACVCMCMCVFEYVLSVCMLTCMSAFWPKYFNCHLFLLLQIIKNTSSHTAQVSIQVSE